METTTPESGALPADDAATPDWDETWLPAWLTPTQEDRVAAELLAADLRAVDRIAADLMAARLVAATGPVPPVAQPDPVVPEPPPAEVVADEVEPAPTAIAPPPPRVPPRPARRPRTVLLTTLALLVAGGVIGGLLWAGASFRTAPTAATRDHTRVAVEATATAAGAAATAPLSAAADEPGTIPPPSETPAAGPTTPAVHRAGVAAPRARVSTTTPAGSSAPVSQPGPATAGSPVVDGPELQEPGTRTADGDAPPSCAAADPVGTAVDTATETATATATTTAPVTDDATTSSAPETTDPAATTPACGG